MPALPRKNVRFQSAMAPLPRKNVKLQSARGPSTPQKRKAPYVPSPAKSKYSSEAQYRSCPVGGW